MSDDTPIDHEDELRRQLRRLGTAMEAVADHDPHRVISLEDDGDRLRHRPNRLVAAGAGVAVAAALVIGLVATHLPPRQPTEATRTGEGGSSTTTPAPPTVVPKEELLGFLMPATAAQHNDGTDMNLGNFIRVANAHQGAECLRGKGWPDRVVDYFAHRADATRHKVLVSNEQFPDVTMLESGTFGITSASQPTPDEVAMDAAIPKDRQEAAFADLRDCEGQDPNPPFGYFHGAHESPLVTSIMSEGSFGGMTTDPTYVGALETWRSCMADGGVQTTSLDDFFGQVDGVQRSDLGAAAKDARTSRLAKLYGQCVAPLSKVTDAYRLAARDRVVATHKAQLDELLSQVNRDVVALEAKYGISYR